MSAWSATGAGNLEGRRVVVTGANSGIGLEASRLLLARGAEVVLACRNTAKGESAAEELNGDFAGRAVFLPLDLADLASVRRFADLLEERVGRPSDLVNNAAVMACPFALTADGFELQMGTNHLGHVALTQLLLPRLAEPARIVFVSSIAARGGRLTSDMTAENIVSPVPYSRNQVYSNTKQANLLYSRELARRLDDAGRQTISLAVHPGVAPTELFARQLRDNNRGFLVPVVLPVMRLMLHSARSGALPILRALTEESLVGGELIGPRHLGGSRGAPQLLKIFKAARNDEAASRLYELSAELVGVQPAL